MTQELLDAVAPGKVDVWDRYLDGALIHVDENGIVRTKTELLKELKPLPPGLKGSIAIERFEARVLGDFAVVAEESQERLDYHGQILRSRFRSVDTWRRTPAGWRLVAQHVAAVLKDPPAVRLSQTQLCEYNGTYKLAAQIQARVACTADGLRVEREARPPTIYKAELLDVFFAEGQPRSRRIFVRDSAGKIMGFVDRREGEDISWTRAN
jgi:hypothetical protein